MFEHVSSCQSRRIRAGRGRGTYVRGSDPWGGGIPIVQFLMFRDVQTSIIFTGYQPYSMRGRGFVISFLENVKFKQFPRL